MTHRIAMAVLAASMLFSATRSFAAEVAPSAYVGNVYGTVVDAAERPIAGARVVLIERERDSAFVEQLRDSVMQPQALQAPLRLAATTDAQGEFLINHVPTPYPSRDYTIIATAPGRSAAVIRGAHVLPGASMALEAHLAIGDATRPAKVIEADDENAPFRYRHERPFTGGLAAESNQHDRFRSQSYNALVYATREGLVGGTCANGHIIVPDDHFVALPSGRALSSNGGYEKQVRLTYGNRTVVAPVWDVGPWNSHDNYWEPAVLRAFAPTLPIGTPESWAAFYQGFNGGLNEKGRKVGNPAGIDLADGTFDLDLAMPDNDYVSVEFLWLSDPAPAPARGDFDRDGSPDLMWQNSTSGQRALWLMKGTVQSGIANLPTLPNTAWQIAGTADFNADGSTDVLLRNYTSGANAIWLMNGTSQLTTVNLPNLPNTAYRFEGIADFNADGRPDILLRNPTTGANAVWLMNGTTFAGIANLPGLPGANFVFEGTGDFNADGKADVVIRNTANGANALWLLDGISLLSIVNLPALPNPAYMIRAVADYNADGKPDLVWRNPATGANAVWLMNGTTQTVTVNLPGLVDAAWEIVGPR
ncbi:MAG: hypothetical protein JWO56_1269 [Acidobacteria bacterium]|nr:hypothetical protein [Acidobacteriota bacterium]